MVRPHLLAAALAVAAAIAQPALAQDKAAEIAKAQVFLKANLVNRHLRGSNDGSEFATIMAISFPGPCLLGISRDIDNGAFVSLDFRLMRDFDADNEGLVFDLKNGQAYIDLPDLDTSLWAGDYLDLLFGDCDNSAFRP
jgi:hypothetical protein